MLLPDLVVCLVGGFIIFSSVSKACGFLISTLIGCRHLCGGGVVAGVPFVEVLLGQSPRQVGGLS